MPTPTRHFIGTSAATPELIVRWCQQQWPTHLPEGLLFCVPTSLAMRRLRDALTKAYHAFHGVRFTLPAGLVSYFSTTERHTLATPSEQLTAWDKVFDWLQTEDEENLVATWLFPGKKSWLARAASRYTVAQRFIQLRSTLAENILDFSAVAQHPHTKTLEPREKHRWEALAALEAKYREVLTTAQLRDPTDAQLATFREPIAHPIESNLQWRLIIACIPDMMPALEGLFNAAPACDILVQAEPSEADRFTSAGTPDPTYWQQAQLSIADDCIKIAETPIEEAATIEAFLAKSGRVAPSKICLGVLNHEVMPTLTASFAAHGIRIFEPDPIHLSAQPAVRLLQTLFRFFQVHRVDVLVPLLSSPELATFVKSDYTTLRKEYADLIEGHQPTQLADAIGFLPPESPLRALFQQIRHWLQGFANHPCEGARTLLTDLYGTCHTDPVKDAMRFATFDALQQLFEELENIRLDGVVPTLELLNARLNQITLHPIRGAAECSYEGRLEFLWSTAERFALAGLNEGIFPDTQFEDAFLPNQFRSALGLRADHTRLSRDAYLVETLCKRIPAEAICLSCSRINHRGDWLKPSRLFFRCPPKQQKERARKLFLTTPDKKTLSSADTALTLPTAPHTWGSPNPITRLSPSAISTFLMSKLDFWLKYVLKLKDTEALPHGVPANTFGTLIHSALETLPQTASTDPDELNTFLANAFLKAFAEQYGTTPSVELLAVRHAGLKRLARAAELEAASRQQGWQTQFVENGLNNKRWEVKLEIDGTPIILHGNVDRIDKNTHTGQWRIIDYKTSAKGDAPNTVHYSAKTDKKSQQVTAVQWKNFQLPIYRLMLRSALNIPTSTPIELAYFTLPSGSNGGISPFNDPVSEAATLEDLRATLQEILTCTPEQLYDKQAIEDAPYLKDCLKHLLTPFLTQHEADTPTN